MMRVPNEPMTIEQLKRYMDRRFDRLERTKADKRDLRRFLTRREFRTTLNRELKRFATKDDLKRFATKDDLKRFATKGDLNDLRRFMISLNNRTRADLQRAVDMILNHHSMVLDEHERRITDLERR